MWIGSDPFRTVLLSDWLGSNVNEGAGAKSNCDCKSSIATAFRTRAIWASGDCLWSHLRARSLLLRPETMPGWEAKIPTQTKTKNPLKDKKLISFGVENLEEEWVWSKEEKVVGLKLSVYLSYFLLVSHSSTTRIILQFIFYGIRKFKSKSIRSLEHVGKFKIHPNHKEIVYKQYIRLI